MSVLETIIDFIAPHTCVGCDAEGTLLCATCTSAMPFPESSPELADASALTSVIVVAHYGGTAKELVWRMKFTGARAAAKVIAVRMSERYVPANNTAVVPIPTATKRIRQRGYDQAALLAQYYANQANLSYLPCLRRYGQKQQRGSNRDDRLVQLEGQYEVKDKKAVYGRNILLIDDVTTTGATLEQAAKTLLAAGAKQVSALVFARA